MSESVAAIRFILERWPLGTRRDDAFANLDSLLSALEAAEADARQKEAAIERFLDDCRSVLIRHQTGSMSAYDMACGCEACTAARKFVTALKELRSPALGRA